jgi:hypothetical protein
MGLWCRPQLTWLLQPNLRDQLFISFDLLASLHPAVRDSIAEQIVRGLLIIISQNRDIVRYVRQGR